MACPNCGGHMHGDGVTEPYHCERIERPDIEPDANPVYCEEETMEQKLANCGRCGLEPVLASAQKYGVETSEPLVVCPAGHLGYLAPKWNSEQFAARTERINAAAVAICAAHNDRGTYLQTMIDAEVLITAQDAAARVRWAEMQKGE